MKAIKYILSVIVLAAVLWSCEENDFNNLDFVNASVAPTNVSAFFDVTQDNTGLVTITPNSEGASSYSIYYGDNTIEPEVVAQGESATHTYGEGSYSIRIVATGLGGKTSEATVPLEVSFKAPENLEITAAVDDANPFLLNVSATAEYAASFLVYFDTSNVDEEPTPLALNETVSFEYTSVGDYMIKVVALSGGAETIEATQDITIEKPTVLPIDFEIFDVNTFQGFGGASNAVIDNPDASGNTSAAVGQIIKAGPEVWAGNVITLSSPIDFSSKKVITMDVWSPRAGGKVLLKLENLADADINMEVEATTEGNSAWEEVVFDFSTIDVNQTYQKLVMFFDIGTVGDGSADWTFYIDNIEQSSGAIGPMIPLGFESPTFDYGIWSFGGPSFEPIPAAIVDNPDPSGSNTSGKVFEIEKTSGAQVWAGAGISLDGATDFTNGTTVTVDVWSPTAGTPILYKMEDSTSPPDANGNPSVIVEVVINTTVANQWETLTFDLTTYGDFSTSNSYDKVVLFPNFNNSGTGSTYYFDNIQLTN